jgi:hypothetical protein
MRVKIRKRVAADTPYHPTLDKDIQDAIREMAQAQEGNRETLDFGETRTRLQESKACSTCGCGDTGSLSSFPRVKPVRTGKDANGFAFADFARIRGVGLHAWPKRMQGPDGTIYRRYGYGQDGNSVRYLAPEPVTRKAYDEVGQILAFEQGELNEKETVALFQYLIDTGHVWRLQGTYGRMAKALIDAGYCHPASKVQKPEEPEESKKPTGEMEPFPPPGFRMGRRYAKKNKWMSEAMPESTSGNLHRALGVSEDHVFTIHELEGHKSKLHSKVERGEKLSKAELHLMHMLTSAINAMRSHKGSLRTSMEDKWLDSFNEITTLLSDLQERLDGTTEERLLTHVQEKLRELYSLVKHGLQASHRSAGPVTDDQPPVLRDLERDKHYYLKWRGGDWYNGDNNRTVGSTKRSSGYSVSSPRAEASQRKAKPSSYLSLEQHPDKLILRLTDEGKKTLESHLEQDEQGNQIWSKHPNKILAKLLEDLRDSGWDLLRPAEVGISTDAPILAHGVQRDAGQHVIGADSLYWFPDYQVLNAIDALLDRGEVVFPAPK